MEQSQCTKGIYRSADPEMQPETLKAQAPSVSRLDPMLWERAAALVYLRHGGASGWEGQTFKSA